MGILRWICDISRNRDIDISKSSKKPFNKGGNSAIESRIANLSRDFRLLQDARGDADEMIRNDPGLLESEHALLRKQVLSRYGRALDLGDVG